MIEKKATLTEKETRLKISEIIGKRMMSLSSATIEGIVLDIFFDDKLTRAKWLKVTNEEEVEVEERFVSVRALKSIEGKNDVLTVTNSDSLKPRWLIEGEMLKNPMNAECFNQDGVLVGKISDINLTEKCEVVEIEIKDSSGKIKREVPKNILNFSETVVIFNDTGKKIALKKTPQKKFVIPKILSQEVSIQKQSSTSLVEVPKKIKRDSENNLEKHFRYLMGKTLSKDIKDENGKTILKEGAVVGVEEVNLAKRSGRLVHLALNAD